MADEARLVFELVDRSTASGGGRSSPAPSTPSGAPDSGTSLPPSAGAAAGANNSNSATTPGMSPASVPSPSAAQIPPDAAASTEQTTAAETPEVVGQEVADAASAAAALQQVTSVAGGVGSAASGGVGALPGILTGLATSGAEPVALAITAGLAIPAAVGASALALSEQIRGEIGSVSPEVAAANARAQVERTLQTFSTAERLGAEIAAITEARSRIGIAGTRARDVLAEPLLQSTGDALGIAAAFTEVVASFVEKNPGLAKWLASFGIQTATGINPDVIGLQLEQLNKLLEKLGFGGAGIGDFGTDPLSAYSETDFLPLPAPFNSTEETAMGGAFADIPGIDW